MKLSIVNGDFSPARNCSARYADLIRARLAFLDTAFGLSPRSAAALAFISPGVRITRPCGAGMKSPIINPSPFNSK